MTPALQKPVFSEIIVAYPENQDPCFLDLGASWG
jgi:hypothetical protein